MLDNANDTLYTKYQKSLPFRISRCDKAAFRRWRYDSSFVLFFQIAFLFTFLFIRSDLAPMPALNARLIDLFRHVRNLKIVYSLAIYKAPIPLSRKHRHTAVCRIRPPAACPILQRDSRTNSLRGLGNSSRGSSNSDTMVVGRSVALRSTMAVGICGRSKKILWVFVVRGDYTSTKFCSA